ncbi:MAG: DVU0298 family protein [Desulfobulbus sp.]|jgi:hypothetical protein
MSSKAEILLKPWCPFCGMDVGRPTESPQRKMREFATGTCECGAVYVSEVTGHNIGAAMVECLVTACHGNGELAWDLLPEDDYLDGIVEDYDEITHQVVPKRNLDGRAVRGVLYFVRLHGPMAELVHRSKAGQEEADGDAEAGVAAADVPIEPERDPKRVRKRAGKQQVKDLVAAGDIDALVDLCFDDRKTLRYMQRLLYTPDSFERYRTAWILGQVGGRVATREPGPVADMLHRLFGSSADSASSAWGMIEAIGALISARPDIYGAFARHLFNFMGDPGTREAVLWGLGEIAAARPELIRQLPFYALFPLLGHANPLYRGLTLRILGRIKAREASLQILGLQHDDTSISFCEAGNLVTTTVADLALTASRTIHKENDHGT